MLLGCDWTSPDGLACQRDARGTGGLCRIHAISTRLIASFERSWLKTDWGISWWFVNCALVTWVAYCAVVQMVTFRSGANLWVEGETNPQYFLVRCGLALVMAARCAAMAQIQRITPPWAILALFTAGACVVLEGLFHIGFGSTAGCCVLVAIIVVCAGLDAKRGTVVPAAALLGLVLLALSVCAGCVVAIARFLQITPVDGQLGLSGLLVVNGGVAAVVIESCRMLWSNRRMISVSEPWGERWRDVPLGAMSLLGQTWLVSVIFASNWIGLIAMTAIQVAIWRHARLDRDGGLASHDEVDSNP